MKNSSLTLQAKGVRLQLYLDISFICAFLVAIAVVHISPFLILYYLLIFAVHQLLKGIIAIKTKGYTFLLLNPFFALFQRTGDIVIIWRWMHILTGALLFLAFILSCCRTIL